VASRQGLGVWSLVLQRVAAECVYVGSGWYISRWRPRFVYDTKRLRPLISFSSYTFLTHSISVLAVRVQEIILGTILGVADVATNRIAWRLTDVLGSATIQPLSAVLLPTFSALQTNKSLLGEALSRSLALGTFVTAPASAGLAIIAPELVVVLFGEQWVAAGKIASILCLMLPIALLKTCISQLLTSVGLPQYNALSSAMTMVFAIVAALLSRFGLEAFAWATVVATGASAAIQVGFLLTKTATSGKTLLAALVPSIAGAAIMYILLMLATKFIPGQDFNLYVALLAKIASGALIYATFMLLIFPKMAMSFLSVLKG
jgi:O-antigen/teichoic acid export membrane protein